MSQVLIKANSLVQIASKFVATHLLYEVGSDERIVPKMKPGELNIPASVAQQLLYQLRATRTLTYELLELFNNCHLNELCLVMDLSNSSPFSYPHAHITLRTSANSLNNSISNAVSQTRVCDKWLELISQKHPELVHLDLTKAYQVSDRGAQIIINSLRQLMTLHLNKCKKLTDSAFKNLKLLTNLKTLSLGATRITNATIISNVLWLTKLVALDIHSTIINDAAFYEICNALKNLETLIVSATRITDESFIHISKLVKLVNLDCSFTNITATSVQSLSALTRLVMLNISVIADINAHCAAYFTGLQELEYINLASTEMDDFGLISIAQMTNIRRLDLSRTHVTDAGVCLLTSLENLSLLYLPYTRISDASLQALSRMTTLRSLKISFCFDVTNNGVFCLQGLTNLTSLDLGSPNITNQSIAYLTNLKCLRTLTLWETKITDSAIQALSVLSELAPLDARLCKKGAGTFIFRDDEPFSQFT
jgi:Leucine-rich repeat (LRR) protein